ncbi:sarcosine dehydrogenase, mitochondrial-like isoform X1 [Cylas formicarius]|uniref:sarcosine dehydrogenase, mitochondrial-like isoform X1 n=2 Tax=Cylas formicarius TaxID=197179 RepID=UPI0029589CE8|nr:sarcosine dehydrogenase, mitochondrial-like isoform X1 [Cylas formicarius]
MPHALRYLHFRKVLRNKEKNIFRKYYSTNRYLPESVDVTIIGGGVAGCSTFYQLSKKGLKTILLEKNKLTSGTTWHTNGLIWSLRPSDTDILMLRNTLETINKLEEDSGVDPGFIHSGGIFIARTRERFEEYKRLHTIGHFFKNHSKLLTPKETLELCPVLEPSAFYGALYTTPDGYIDPTMYCNALAKGGRRYGGLIFEDVTVKNILTAQSTHGIKKVVGIETDKGFINSNIIVNAAGVWGDKIARLAGTAIPIQPMKHSYVVTNDIPGFKGAPPVRCHDGSVCFKPQGFGMTLGGYEMNPEILDEAPEDFNFKLYELDRSLFEVHYQNAVKICPVLERTGIKADICGPESFTPDHKPVVGEDPNVIGLFHNVGYNSGGMMFSGGVSEQLAVWIKTGSPNIDMHSYDVKRFSPEQRKNKRWIAETSHESYAKNYSIVYPHEQKLAGRNFKTDAFHQHLVANGAIMEQVFGWERPAYFLTNGTTAPAIKYDWYGCYNHRRNSDQRFEKEVRKDLTFDFSDHHNLIKAEALACKTSIALFNLSSYTKMSLIGPDAEEAVQWLFTSNIKPGKITKTIGLNSRAGIVADVTVVALEDCDEDIFIGAQPNLQGKRYYVVADSGSGYQIKCHIRKELNAQNFDCELIEVSDKFGILSLKGPNSHQLLMPLIETPISKLSYEILKINAHECMIINTNDVGELGWQIHIPVSHCMSVLNSILDAGKKLNFKITYAGFRALESLSLEKEAHVLNEDVRVDDNPLEAGLSHLCRCSGQYQGKFALKKIEEIGPKKRRSFFALEHPIALYGLETIWRDNEIVGYLRRGGYSFSMDCSVGIGYVCHSYDSVVDSHFLRTGRYQIEVRNKKYPAIYLGSPILPETFPDLCLC